MFGVKICFNKFRTKFPYGDTKYFLHIVYRKQNSTLFSFEMHGTIQFNMIVRAVTVANLLSDIISNNWS